jgi:hypothetical protein
MQTDTAELTIQLCRTTLVVFAMMHSFSKSKTRDGESTGRATDTNPMLATYT